MSIPDKTVFPKGQMATVHAATPAAKSFFILSWDFTRPDFRWVDDPNAQTVSASSPTLPGNRQVIVMGAGAKTPYNPAWTEDEARTAFYVELGLPLPASAVVVPAPVHVATEPHVNEQMS